MNNSHNLRPEEGVKVTYYFLNSFCNGIVKTMNLSNNHLAFKLKIVILYCERGTHEKYKN